MALTACTDPSFKIKGEIEGADGGSVILEKADHAGYWIPIDSARLSGSGSFSISSPAPDAPQIYRLDYNGEYVYFPVDSIETITLKAPAERFATDFSLEGSDNATALAKFEKELIAFTPYFSNPDSLNNFKRRVYTAYLQDAKGSVVSYYALTKTIGNRALFGDEGDDRYFAAVATSFRQYRPNDPRTVLLEETATRLRRDRNARAGRKTVVEANEINIIEIALTDEDGRPTPLSKAVGGKPTLLMFCQLTDPATPALNAALRSKTQNGAFKVYQVGLDGSRLDWRNSAKNLPWTTVYGGSPEDVATLAQSYQLAQLPAFFIIDAAGNLTDRAYNLDDALRKLQ